MALLDDGLSPISKNKPLLPQVALVSVLSQQKRTNKDSLWDGLNEVFLISMKDLNTWSPVASSVGEA